jgi:oligopeptide transport system ATP-binding protein
MKKQVKNKETDSLDKELFDESNLQSIKDDNVDETNAKKFQKEVDSTSPYNYDEDAEHNLSSDEDLIKEAKNIKEIINKKVKYKQEYVDKKVILSVNHLKQYFFFGKGHNKFKLKAVHDVNFQVHEGEVFGIVGESGCGKTTTGRSIIRLYNITSGSIYYKGVRIAAGSRWNEKEIKFSKIRYAKKVKSLKKELSSKKISLDEYKSEVDQAKTHFNNVLKIQKSKIKQIKYDDKHVNKKLMSEIQMIFQDPIDSLDPRMTVESIISEGLQIQGFHNKKQNHEKVVKALEKVGLIEDYANRYPHEFSGGQRQRIGIARALIMNPKFLICDEPVSALDVSVRAQIINLLEDLRNEMGLSMIFIAHDLSIVKYFCDRIAVMYFGEVVEEASSEELFKHPLHPYTNSLLSAIPQPDPELEKTRTRITYNPQEVHDYSKEKPKFVEILPGHFILANSVEIAKYKEQIKKLDSENKKK